MANRVVTTAQNNPASLATTDGNAYPVIPTAAPAPGSGIPFYVFSLAPTLTQEVNTYNTSSALYAGVQAQRSAGVSGQVKVSLVGPSGASPTVHWTAGVQNIDDFWFTSQETTPAGYSLLVDEGVVWTMNTLWNDTIMIGANTATPVVTVSTTLFCYLINEGNVSSLHAGAPFFHVVSGGELSVLVTSEAAWGGNGFGGSGTQPVANVDVGGACFIILVAGSSLFANSLAGAGNIQVFYDASSTVDTNQPAASNVTYNLLDQATAVSYAAGVANNWPAAPVQVAAALDQLATGQRGVFSDATTTGTKALTAAQATASILRFTQALTGNLTYAVPAGRQGFYIVDTLGVTLNGHTITFSVVGSAASTPNYGNGVHIFYSDGTNPTQIV